MIDQHLPHDPELNRLIESSYGLLQSLGTTASNSSDAAACIASAMREAQASPTDIAALKSAVDRLFDGGHWRHALPLATRLLMVAPHDPSASYRLGTCLQRMGQHAQALTVFAQCAMAEGNQPSPGPLLRIGECMAALGEQEEALNAFDACVELARNDPQYGELQDLATRKADRLRFGR